MTKRKKVGRSVFKRGDGSWILSYEPEPGAAWKQHRLGFLSSEREAIRIADAWLAMQKAAGTLPAATRTVAQAAEEWLKIRARHPDLAGATVQDNKSHLEQHILPRFGATPLGKLGSDQIRDWLRGLREKIGPSTVRNVVNTFSALYEDARAERWVVSASNVVREPGVRKEMPSIGAARDEIVTLSIEIAQELIASEKVPEHRRLRYVIAFLTGLRDGEIAGLTWADIDLDAAMPVLRVDKAHAFKAEIGKHAGLSAPKTKGSKRTIPLHHAVVAGLRSWRADGCQRWLDTPIVASTPLFPSPRTGTHWRPRSAEDLRVDLEAIDRPFATAKGTAVDFHATRRSLTTWLADLGIEESLRERILGHAPKTTIGQHYTGELLRRMAEALALVPLRWGQGQVDPPEPSGRVPPASSDPHCAGPVRPHNEASGSASGPVAQWIEQRFPNSLPSGPEETEVTRQTTVSVTRGAQRNEHAAALARGERNARLLFAEKEPYETKLARLRDAADATVARLVDCVVAGEASNELVAEVCSDAMQMLRCRELRKAVTWLDRSWAALDDYAFALADACGEWWA